MSLNSESISLILLLLELVFISILLLIGLFIKNEDHKITISIGMSLSLIILNIFNIDPLYDLIYLFLLICNLCYFFMFIFKMGVIERGKEVFSSQSNWEVKNQKYDIELDESKEEKIGDTSE